MHVSLCKRCRASVIIGSLVAILILCAAVIVAVYLFRARNAERHIAEQLVEEFQGLGAFQTDGTLQRASRLCESLRLCVASGQPSFSSQDLNEKVMVARCSAISNLVASLESYSGMQYGTNVQAWEDWLETQRAGSRAGRP